MRKGTDRRVIGACVAALLLAGASFFSAAPGNGSADTGPTRSAALHAFEAADANAALASSVSRRWGTASADGRRGQLIEPFAVLAGLLVLAVRRAVWSESAASSLLAPSITPGSADPARAPPILAR